MKEDIMTVKESDRTLNVVKISLDSQGMFQIKVSDDRGANTKSLRLNPEQMNLLQHGLEDVFGSLGE